MQVKVPPLYIYIYIIEEIVRQVICLSELYEDARSGKYKSNDSICVLIFFTNEKLIIKSLIRNYKAMDSHYAANQASAKENR